MRGAPVSTFELIIQAMRGSAYEGTPPPEQSASSRGDKRRVALVIGNAAYQQAPNLQNPTNDARLIADRLKAAGFSDITRLDDAKYQDFRRAVRDFAEKADGSEMAVIYYAGHGIELDGQNHMIPIDAVLRHERDVSYETLSLAEMMKALEGARRLRLIMLDACRDNPFLTRIVRATATRSIHRGLAELDQSNVLVAYAAKAGTTAADGSNHNSPFAEALSRYLVQPGLEVGFIFRHVRDDVLAKTNLKQEPWLYGSLGAEPIYLIPPPAALPPKPPPVAPTPPLVDHEPPQHDIFISYSNHDQTQVAGLAGALEQAGYQVWWDTRLLAGQAFGQEIMQRLDSARAVIVIWTVKSIASQWVVAEADRAREAGKLIPTRDPALDVKTIPLPFGSLHTIGMQDISGIKSSLGRLGVVPRKDRADTGPSVGQDAALWAIIKPSTDPSDFEDFATRFPGSILEPKAVRRVHQLVLKCEDLVELEVFLTEFPHSPRRNQVLSRIAVLEWRGIAKTTSAERLRAFLSRHPGAPESRQAKSRLASLLWNELRSTDAPDELERFAEEFADFPESKTAIAHVESIRTGRAQAANADAERTADGASRRRVNPDSSTVSSPRLAASFALDHAKKPKGRSSKFYEVKLSIGSAPPWAKRVIYKLAPTFEERILQATNRSEGFSETIWTYGDFRVGVEIRSLIDDSRLGKRSKLDRSLHEALIETHGEDKEPSIIQALKDIEEHG